MGLYVTGQNNYNTLYLCSTLHASIFDVSFVFGLHIHEEIVALFK